MLVFRFVIATPVQRQHSAIYLVPHTPRRSAPEGTSMRMYLSSHHLGDQPEQLLMLVSIPGPAAVIANALDAAPADVRARGVQDELAALQELGLTAEELDLRDYFADHQQLAATLARYRVVWVRGGNVFVLRHALAHSGADSILAQLLGRDELVWAGYSAGCCVLAPSLRGLELLVDPQAVRIHEGAEPDWEGMGLLSYAIVPHYRSPHPQSEAAERLVARYRAEGVPYRALQDGQAIIIDT
jgi:dipeptidase E